MAIKQERIDELIATYKEHYQIDLTQDKAQQICECIIRLYEGLMASDEMREIIARDIEADAKTRGEPKDQQ